MAAPVRKYPVQIVLLVSTEVGELIERLSVEQELPKTSVVRSLLHAGIRKAGYSDVLTVDRREVPIEALGPEAEPARA